MKYYYSLICYIYCFYSEQEILKAELKTVQAVNSRLKQKLTELEEDLKRSKEEMDKLSKSNKSDDEVDQLHFLLR